MINPEAIVLQVFVTVSCFISPLFLSIIYSIENTVRDIAYNGMLLKYDKSRNIVETIPFNPLYSFVEKRSLNSLNPPVLINSNLELM